MTTYALVFGAGVLACLAVGLVLLVIYANGFTR